MGEVEASITAGEGTAVDVQVKFMGELPALLGTRGHHASLPPGATVGDLLALLSRHYGDDFARRAFSGPATLRHTMLVFVDGENIKGRGGLAASVGEGAVEVIMLPMFGGG